MKVSQPLAVSIPDYGVLFAESVHASDFHMPERRDPFHKVFYVLAGRVSTRCAGGEAQVMSTGNAFVIPEGVSHQLADVVPSTLLLLCVTDAFLQRDPDLPDVWRDLQRPERRQLELSRPARERVERMWRRAMLERVHAQVGGGVTVRTLAAQLLVLLARQQRPVSPDPAVVRVTAVLRELRETFYDDWNVDRAAARAALSRRRFTEVFRAATQRTFAEELLDLRLTHAARLLQDGSHSILGAMFSCGFRDLSHFYRVFRRRFGEPPKRWLAQQAAPARARRRPPSPS